MNAEIMKAYGGATGIATMTFDDGLRKTAQLLDKLCEKYECRASLMLCTHAVNDDTVDFWREIFSHGRLFPESHSTRHHYLTQSHPENLTEQIITSEIEGSLETLRKYLPEYPCLGFGIPYSSYVEEAFAHLYRTFYVVRGGVCAIVSKSYKGMVQSLDPVPGSNEAGGWYRPIGIRMQPEKSYVNGYEDITVDNLIAHLNKCATEGGWFISGAHGIVEGENLDIKEEDISRIMARMQELSHAGRLWVTDLSTATKYMRERQGAHLEYTEARGGCTIRITLDEMTPDGLPLTPSVFDHPLTVRVELPADARSAKYGKSTSEGFTADGKKYAYVNVVPNGEAVNVSFI